jgi:hypothetical protein
MNLALRFRVIHERNYTMSMEMSFLSHSLYVMQCQAPINRGTGHRVV